MADPRASASIDWRLTGAQPEKGANRDAGVARIAGEQSGVVATRQLIACGVNHNAICVRVARGNLHPVFRGVYAVGHDALTQTGFFTAAVLACGPGAVLSHHAAAAHLGLRPWKANRAPEVIVPGAGGRKIDGIHAHRSRLDECDVWTRENIRVTSPARTILDVGASMRSESMRRVVRQALAEGRVSVRQLNDVVTRCARHRGAATLRVLIADGHVPTRSELEDLGLDLLDSAGIQRPEINPTLRLDGRTIRPDMLWRDRRLVVELDGRRWHHDPLTTQDDADRQAMLEAHAHRVLRITWKQIVNQPRQTLRRIRAALEIS